MIDALMEFEDLTFFEALKAFDDDYHLRLFADAETIARREKPRKSIYAMIDEDVMELRETRAAAYEGYFYFNAILRQHKSLDFKSREEEREFWDAVRLRQECERVYEELAGF